MSRSGATVLTSLVAASCAGAWFWFQRGAKPVERPGRSAEALEGPIEETVEATGSVVPLNRVEVRPPIGGRIERLLAQEGAEVRAGDVIAWMSSNDRAAILDAARAQGPEELKRWQDAYKPTPIVAPLSGVVILRNVVVGQTVDPGTVLYAMADSLIILAQVDESDIGRVRLGIPARIILDSYPDQGVPGRVFDILYEGKNVSNVITYGVKVRPSRVPAFFRSQMTANVGFTVHRKERALWIPAGALQETPEGRNVLVPGRDGKPAPRRITTGIESGDKVEVLSGLAAGERVLLSSGRYAPQQGPQASPLTFGGGSAGGGSESRRRRGAQR